MSIETAIVSEVAQNIALDPAITGTVPVYAHIAPQSASYPFIVYSLIGTTVEHHIAGTGGDLTRAAIDLSVYSETMAEQSLVVDNFKRYLHGRGGRWGAENLDVRLCFIDSINTFSQSDIDGTDEQIYRAAVTLNIFYNWST